MNWKEFLKPTLVKLVLFVILFSIFVPFLYYENACENYLCLEGHTCDFSEGPVSITLLLIYGSITNCITIFGVAKISLPFAAFGLVISYLVACGIIFLYHKVRKL
jgi:hypothetical protein